MTKEQNRLIVGKNVIPTPSGVVSIDSYLWRRIAWQQEQEIESKRLSQEKRKIYYETLDLAYRGLFDLGSGGLAHKLGSVIKLTEDEDLEQTEAAKLCWPIGKSNFYVSCIIQDTVQKRKADNIFPSWFFKHFSEDDKFRNLFLKTHELEEKTIEEVSNPDEVNIQNLCLYALEDLYCTYELSVIIFEFMETKAAGIVKGSFRPHDHRHERNMDWKKSTLISPLRTRFNWPKHGQPTLQELLDASYQTLIEKGPQLRLEEPPTIFTFVNPTPL